MGRRWVVLVTTGACAIGGGGCGRDLGRSLSASGWAGSAGSGVLPPAIRPVSPALCSGGLALASTLTLSPVPAGRPFTRCATLGPDMRWTPTLSPDGSRLAARTPTGTVRLLDTASWREVAQAWRRRSAGWMRSPFLRTAGSSRRSRRRRGSSRCGVRRTGRSSSPSRARRRRPPSTRRATQVASRATASSYVVARHADRAGRCEHLRRGPRRATPFCRCSAAGRHCSCASSVVINAYSATFVTRWGIRRAACGSA